MSSKIFMQVETRLFRRLSCAFLVPHIMIKLDLLGLRPSPNLICEMATILVYSTLRTTFTAFQYITRIKHGSNSQKRGPISTFIAISSRRVILRTSYYDALNQQIVWRLQSLLRRIREYIQLISKSGEMYSRTGVLQHEMK